MAIKNGTSNYDPTPPASESPYRDSEDAGPVPQSSSQAAAPPPPPYQNYGSTLPTSNSNGSPFQSPEEEREYWQRYHKDMKISKVRKVFHLLLAFTLLGGLFYFLGSLATDSRHEDVDYAPAPSPPLEDGGKFVSSPSWSNPIRLPTNEWPSSDLPTFSRSTEFRLSTSSSNLFLHAYGSHFGGKVEMGRSDSNQKESENEILVKIQAIYSDQELLDTVSIGRLNKDGKEGVGLYQTKDFKWNIWDDFVDFQILVVFPFHERDSAALKLKTWETDVDNMSLDVGPLEGGVLFENGFDLKSKNGRINVRSAESKNYINLDSENGSIESSQSLKAPTTNVRSANGRLGFAKIQSSNSLKLHSENGQISCLECSSPNQEIETKSGHLEGGFNVNDSLILKTNTGGIDAKVRVLEPAKGKNDSQVTVSATSRAGRVSVDYLEQAKSASLISTVKTNAGAAQVNLAKYFQGEWKAKTDVGSVVVKEYFKDKDHHFKVVFDKSTIPGHRIEGKVWWGSNSEGENGPWGLSSVESNAGRVQATFDG